MVKVQTGGILPMSTSTDRMRRLRARRKASASQPFVLKSWRRQKLEDLAERLKQKLAREMEMERPE